MCRPSVMQKKRKTNRRGHREHREDGEEWKMQRVNSFSVFWISLCTLWLGGFNPPSAAPPRDEILRLVPDDAGLCLLVQNLRDQFDRFHQSPFADRMAASPIGR